MKTVEKIILSFLFSITILGIFLFIVVESSCDAPDYYQYTSSRISVVEIKGLNVDTPYTFSSGEPFLEPYYEIQKATFIHDSLPYGLLLVNGLEYCFNPGANEAYAVHESGILGCKQQIESAQLSVVDDKNRLLADISDSLLAADSVKGFKWVHQEALERANFVHTAAGINAWRDSFNLSFSRHPPIWCDSESGDASLFLFPRGIFSHYPSNCRLDLRIKFTDGDSLRCFVEIRK